MKTAVVFAYNNIGCVGIEALVTPRTRVIVPVHYAGMACDMDAIMAIANRHGLLVVEDAAQAVDSWCLQSTDLHGLTRIKTGGQNPCESVKSVDKRALGGIGHFGSFSFATNNAHMFYLKFRDHALRENFIADMKSRGIGVCAHYLCLHDSKYALERGAAAACPEAERWAETIVRLPLFPNVDVASVVGEIESWCGLPVDGVI